MTSGGRSWMPLIIEPMPRSSLSTNSTRVPVSGEKCSSVRRSRVSASPGLLASSTPTKIPTFLRTTSSRSSSDSTAGCRSGESGSARVVVVSDVVVVVVSAGVSVDSCSESWDATSDSRVAANAIIAMSATPAATMSRSTPRRGFWSSMSRSGASMTRSNRSPPTTCSSPLLSPRS